MIRPPEQEPVIPAKRMKPGKAITETARVRPAKNVKLKTKPSATEKKVRKTVERQTRPATQKVTRPQTKLESFKVTCKRPTGASSSSGGVFGNPANVRMAMQKMQSGQF